MSINRNKFTHSKMTELLNNVVDKYTKDMPTQVGITLPKLKKSTPSKTTPAIKLPKLKKSKNIEGASV